MIATKSVAVIGAMACAGCSSIVLKSELANETKDGLVYALPKGQVQLEAVRKVVTSDDVAAAEKAVEDTKTAVDGAKKRLAEATEARDLAQSNVDALTGSEPTARRDDLESKLATASILLRARTADLEVAKIKLAEAGKRLTQVRGNLNKMEQTVALKALPAVADSEKRYVARLDPSFYRDDNVKLVTANGLLNSTSSESIGQAGAILVNLISAVAAVKGAGVPGQLKRNVYSAIKPTADEEACKEFAFKAVFDPTNSSEVNEVIRNLREESQDTLALTKPTPNTGAGTYSNVDGLAYRAPTTITVEVKLSSTRFCRATANDSFASLTTTVPDSSSTYFVKVNGASFTKSKVDYTFKDGMLVSFNSEQPSQAVALARLPIDVLKAVVEVPASILKLRVDYDSQAEALIQGKTNQLKAQIDLIGAQKALEDARQEQSGSNP